MTGHYLHLVEKRDAVLSSTRMSKEARARALGTRLHPPIVAKSHTVSIDLKTGTRTVETTDYGELMRARPKGAKQQTAAKRKRIGLGPRRLLPAKARHVTPAFCEAFGVAIDDIFTPHRGRKFARPRQAAMHFLHRKMKMSQPEIGAFFQRDHTTVHYAWKAVETLLIEDAEFRRRYHVAVSAILAAWAQP